MNKEKIGVLGAGTWGMALARMLCNDGKEVQVWSALPDEIEEYSRTRRHRNLTNMIIPDEIDFTGDIKEVCSGKDILLFAVPSVFVRQTARAAAEFIPDGQVIVDVAKGLEPRTFLTMSEVLRDELKGCDVDIVALSGPTHAEEVALDMPTTIVSACEDISVAEKVQSVFMNPNMRVYTNTDVKGVEVCGALKNIMALASGISAGLGYGDNARAALITRGLVEMRRLGKELGCLDETFSGLAGMGDLIVTATSVHSRNNKCGYLIGQGYSVEDAVKQVGMVVEGINAIPAAMEMSEKYNVEMPIVRAVDAVINHGADPAETVHMLMGRKKKTELSRAPLDVKMEKALSSNRRADDKKMRRVITYGSYDLLHYGHINLLRRARALGDYLIVAISTDEFNWNEKQKKCYFTYEQRKVLIEAIQYVDMVIPEENWDQKRSDMHKYHIDTFVIGDDWKGKFDFLKEEGVDVVYLPRTPEIRSSQIKKD